MNYSSKRGVSVTGYFSFSFLKIFPGWNFRKTILKGEESNEPNNQN